MEGVYINVIIEIYVIIETKLFFIFIFIFFIMGIETKAIDYTLIKSMQ